MSKIFKKVGKAIKGVVNFVKKNWKTIALVAVSVFTMGIATVGFAGFSGAMAAAGGGFGGFMSAVGSTMWGGITALGGTLGIGPGAQGAAAIHGGVQGAGLFSGHAAAALGSKSAQAGIAAQNAANAIPGTSAILHGPPAALAGSPATTPGISSTVVGPAAPGVLPGAGNVGNGLTQQTIQHAAGPSTGGLSPLAQAALITTGGNALAGWAAAKANEPDDPLAMWGVDLTGAGEHAPPEGLNMPAPVAPRMPVAPQYYNTIPGGLMNQQWRAPGAPV